MKNSIKIFAVSLTLMFGAHEMAQAATKFACITARDSVKVVKHNTKGKLAIYSFPGRIARAAGAKIGPCSEAHLAEMKRINDAKKAEKLLKMLK